MNNKPVAERMCVACRQMKPKSQLIRIVRDKASGTVSIDTTGKQNGRGCYLCKNKECIKKFCKIKNFEKVLGFNIEGEILAQLEESVEQD